MTMLPCLQCQHEARRLQSLPCGGLRFKIMLMTIVGQLQGSRHYHLEGVPDRP